MRYLRVDWTHDQGDLEGSKFPTKILTELDAEGWELRKVEFYITSPAAYGSEKDFRAWQSFLADHPYLPTDTVDGPGFRVREIPKTEFDAVWLRVRLEAREARRDGGMIYDKLDAIDEFESTFGNREAVKRVSDLMVSYLAEIAKPLNPITEQATRTAINYRNGLASLADLHVAREAIRDLLRSHTRHNNYDTPEHYALRAAYVVLGSYADPAWSGGASELLSLFWEAMEKFDGNDELLLRKLEVSFA
jgi:hypothetical protein